MANTQPNLYELSGHGIHVTYSTTSITGKPVFSYHDGFQTKSFTGDEIQTQSSILGTLVSVFLMRTIDGPSTSFTVLIPSVRLSGPEVVNISTEGITTLHRFGIPLPPTGQTELYTLHRLHGTARFVVF
ncbi:hypothetical protein UP10_25230 [Bradyrhizobium sp. LTSPM299]|jgi:hypothetical protein|uniref:hypothetical protein n=1 Tax=Bradyrhizobium sp. LTSPM299 TaxID=1619233 RepID=UPI0005C9FF81|nr:hypothetical protein [Bradyrhizobium sp. LTSPM299]KJC58262.1 hypothetical protein UP10_25230 [Bradyrhizobium sp. LTSPM299]